MVKGSPVSKGMISGWILINGPTAEALESRDDLVLKSLGPINVKGRVEPVDVYAVVEWQKS